MPCSKKQSIIHYTLGKEFFPVNQPGLPGAHTGSRAAIIVAAVAPCGHWSDGLLSHPELPFHNLVGSESGPLGARNFAFCGQHGLPGTLAMNSIDVNDH